MTHCWKIGCWRLKCWRLLVAVLDDLHIQRNRSAWQCDQESRGPPQTGPGCVNLGSDKPHSQAHKRGNAADKQRTHLNFLLQVLQQL